jgi:hypothetical protein
MINKHKAIAAVAKKIELDGSTKFVKPVVIKAHAFGFNG